MLGTDFFRGAFLPAPIALSVCLPDETGHVDRFNAAKNPDPNFDGVTYDGLNGLGEPAIVKGV